LRGQKETTAAAIRPQPFADVGYFLLSDLRIPAHEPETTGVELREGLLGQRQPFRRGWRGCD